MYFLVRGYINLILLVWFWPVHVTFWTLSALYPDWRLVRFLDVFALTREGGPKIEVAVPSSKQVDPSVKPVSSAEETVPANGITKKPRTRSTTFEPMKVNTNQPAPVVSWPSKGPPRSPAFAFGSDEAVNERAPGAWQSNSANALNSLKAEENVKKDKTETWSEDDVSSASAASPPSATSANSYGNLFTTLSVVP
ncbi:hypothetical protein M427DRAFT_332074 [Gonapodya prolifera JEL478]|uniref:Uncharacterized protein n=1 Tax=Gonapodya prolifera (strain JEL478) TaxID=1344416 RepID=A0A139ADS1_GONPJ|nr:hypothetical protein M427DRAFT_332074 [Gonapodya prolifera JEL478]|eukprot:KXS14917.1 hypothetical protein M427DRAFT_332074 [Gonapodya prolifera JEL478]